MQNENARRQEVAKLSRFDLFLIEVFSYVIGSNIFKTLNESRYIADYALN